MQVAYMTRKVFADGSDETRIKINPLITRQTIDQAILSRRKNKFYKKLKQAEIFKEIEKLKIYDPDYNRKLRRLECELYARDIASVRRSAHRSRQNLYDICRCNDYQYFVTWTFDPDKIDRLNDKIVKRKFSQFQNYLRKKFPQMHYVAVPEYHEKGGLHFHLLIGGITLDELRATPAHNKRGELLIKNGRQIYNVNRWKLGYSTLSIISNTSAAKHYISKYVSKQHADERLFGKRRYYVSTNTRRPSVQKWVTEPKYCLDSVDYNVHMVSYAKTDKRFAVFVSDGNGVVNYDLNTAETVKAVRAIRDVAESACGTESDLASAAAPRGACPYLTIGTLNSDFQSRNQTETEKHRKKADNDPIDCPNALDILRAAGLID